jgi:hypothetical protein
MTHTAFAAEAIKVEQHVFGEGESLSSLACYSTTLFIGSNFGILRSLLIGNQPDHATAFATLKICTDLKTGEPVVQIELDAELKQVFTLSQGKLRIHDISNLKNLGRSKHISFPS